MRQKAESNHCIIKNLYETQSKDLKDMSDVIDDVVKLSTKEIDHANSELERIQNETANELESLADVENELKEARDKLKQHELEKNNEKDLVNDLQVKQ